MGDKHREMGDPKDRRVRCKHGIIWGQCACCRGKYGMLVIELDRMFFSPPPPEFVGEQVALGIRRMRIGREGKTDSGPV